MKGKGEGRRRDDMEGIGVKGGKGGEEGDIEGGYEDRKGIRFTVTQTHRSGRDSGYGSGYSRSTSCPIFSYFVTSLMFCLYSCV
jgi:hypothetical protein